MGDLTLADEAMRPNENPSSPMRSVVRNKQKVDPDFVPRVALSSQPSPKVIKQPTGSNAFVVNTHRDGSHAAQTLHGDRVPVKFIPKGRHVDSKRYVSAEVTLKIPEPSMEP